MAEHRERCYGCFRPAAQCFCDCIPRLHNHTRVRILQHRREQFHAFNTARIVHRALEHSEIQTGYTPDFAATRRAIPRGTAVLYPGDSAQRLDKMPPAELPREIILLDGTWHHTKTMIRDVPWLRQLPRVCIQPDNPSRYRIRREPSIDSLSSVEAIVDVLRILEPDLAGLDDLLSAFNEMIDRHIAVTGTSAPRFRERKTNPHRIATNIPRVLLQDPARLVVAYGESTPNERRGHKKQRRGSGKLVHWVAKRLGAGHGNEFSRLIQPAQPLSDEVRAHMNLTEQDLQTARSQDEFRAAWQAFIRPDDQLLVYNYGTARLLENAQAAFCPVFALKTIDYVHVSSAGTLPELLTTLQILPHVPAAARRADRRLTYAVTLVQHLRESALRSAAESSVD